VRGRWGRLSHPCSISPLTRRRRSSGDLCPPFPCRPTGSTLVSLSLLACPRGPVGGMSRLLPWGISRRIDVPQLITTILEALHKITSVVK
jgi:hypothetical protein